MLSCPAQLYDRNGHFSNNYFRQNSYTRFVARRFKGLKTIGRTLDSLDRWVAHTDGKTQIHGFSDASTMANGL